MKPVCNIIGARIAAVLVASAIACSAFAATPVARWDVIPFQRVAGLFNIGVVAFHEKGLKVEFSVNGRKTWIANRAMFNARTGVVEYVFPFNAEKCVDGPITIGARVVSSDGEITLLDDLVLYANSRGTLGSRKTAWVDPVNGNEFADGSKESPVKTIKLGVRRVGDGGTVYLLAGEHEMKLVGGGLDRKYWTTITVAPGTDREDIRINGGRSGTEKLRWKGLNFYTTTIVGDNRGLAIGEAGRSMAWFDDCILKNESGRASGVSKPFSNRLRAFVTGGETVDMTQGPDAEIIRSHVMRDIGTEAISRGNVLAANVKILGIDPTGGASRDAEIFLGFAQPPEWCENAILYNVVAVDCNARGIVGRQLRNSAFVNVGAVLKEGSECAATFSLGLENVIFARIKMSGKPWIWMKQKSGIEDVRAKDVRLFGVKTGNFEGLDASDAASGITMNEECDIICFPKGVKQ